MKKQRKSKKRLSEENENIKVIKRLNAIIRFFIELHKILGKKEFTVETSVKILHSLNFTPTEIADILGYKDRGSVSSYLYSKRKKSSDKNEKT